MLFLLVFLMVCITFALCAIYQVVRHNTIMLNLKVTKYYAQAKLEALKSLYVFY